MNLETQETDKVLNEDLYKIDGFEEFLNEDFEPIAYVGDCLSNKILHSAAEKIQTALGSLKGWLEKEVTKNQLVLIQEISKMDRVENIFGRVLTITRRLKKHMEHFQDLVDSPISLVKDSLKKIESALECLEIFDEIISLENHLNRLQRTLPNILESHRENNSSASQGDGRLLVFAGEDVSICCENAKRAQRFLESPILADISVAQQQVTGDIGNLLMGAYYLDSLQDTLQYVVHEVTADVVHVIREMFIEKAENVEPKDANYSNNNIWKKVVAAKDRILQGHRSLILLEGILWRKYPFDTHKPLAAFVIPMYSRKQEQTEQTSSRYFFVDRFFQVVKETLSSQVYAAANSNKGTPSYLLFEQLAGIYPNVWQLFKDTEADLCRQRFQDHNFNYFLSFSLDPSGLLVKEDSKYNLVGAFSACEAHYLVMSFSRLSTPLEDLFETTDSSFHENAVGEFVKLMEAEFLSNIDLIASPSMFLKNMRSVIDMFIAKTEANMNALLAQNWSHLQSSLTRKLERLASFYNGLILFQENLKRFPSIFKRRLKRIKDSPSRVNMTELNGERGLDDTSESLGSIINDEQTSLLSLAYILIDQIFEKAFDYCRRIIIQMNNEEELRRGLSSFGSVSYHGISIAAMGEEYESCSQIILGIVTFLKSFKSSFYSQLRPQSLLNGKIEHFVGRVVLFYLKSLSVIRSMSEENKFQFLADFACLEGFLSTLCPSWTREQKSIYDSLRFFRVLLFTETEQLCGTAENQDLQVKESLRAVQPSIIVHHLLSRCSTPELFPFHQSGWSLESYMDYWETHSEVDICELVDQHLQKVTSNHIVGYAKKDSDIVSAIHQLILVLLNKSDQ
eukprot:jgi/Galph1/3278/GphlegSOOS_G1889.1